MMRTVPFLFVVAGSVFNASAGDIPLRGAEVLGAVKSYSVSDTELPVATARLKLVGGDPSGVDGFGEIIFMVPASESARNWNNQSTVSVRVRMGEAFLGDFNRTHRARIFVQDSEGRRIYLPNRSVVDAPVATEGWLTLEGRPTVDVPIPLGYTDEGFDPQNVTHVGVNFEASRRTGTYEGMVEIKDLNVSFGGEQPVRVLAVNEEILNGEQERANRMNVRLMERLDGSPLNQVFGVNLAWPSVRSPNGDVLQLYGSFLDAPSPWYGEYWDLRNPKVVRSVREDFAQIQATFGKKAVVRIMLFTDMSNGLVFSDSGVPLAVTEQARASMRTLLQIAKEEGVVLMPVLFDFLMADGVSASGPNGIWQSGERVDVIVDPLKRAALARVMEAFIREFANHESVLVWDVMNEPENAAAVVNPMQFADLQMFLAELVDAVHSAGELATVGHRNLHEVGRFLRGRIAVDLGQAHHYPLLETRVAPFDLGSTPEHAFGALPAIWGETPVRPATLLQEMRSLMGAGYRGVLFWSWRGDDATGDGIVVREHRSVLEGVIGELQADAVAAIQSIPYVFTMDDIPMWYVQNPAERLQAYQTYEDVLTSHGISEPVFFVNAGYLSGAAEWEVLRSWHERGWHISNHGARHQPLSGVGADRFWADVDEGTRLLEQELPGWSHVNTFFRHPNSDWGADPEISCRALQVEREFRVLPIHTDIRDWEHVTDYNNAVDDATRAAVRDRLFQALEDRVEEVRRKRARLGVPADQPEVFIIHSTRFARDHLDEVLKRLESRGVRWVPPSASALSQLNPHVDQCRPWCKIAGTCR